jgi:translation initiation factor 1 (eIF-1/SUI1)
MNDIPVWITQIGSLVAILVSVFTLVRNWRSGETKDKIDSTSATVINTQKLQDAYKQAFEDLQAINKTELDSQKKECIQTINDTRRAIQDEERERRGELLVRIDAVEKRNVDLMERNSDLKAQIAAIGGTVQGITGNAIYKWDQTHEKK